MHKNNSSEMQPRWIRNKETMLVQGIPTGIAKQPARFLLMTFKHSGWLKQPTQPEITMNAIAIFNYKKPAENRGVEFKALSTGDISLDGIVFERERDVDEYLESKPRIDFK